jgi:hypothetical protein
MPKLQFSRLGANRPRQELVTETNTEVRNLPFQQPGNDIEARVKICGIAGTGRHHHPIWLEALDFFK